MKSTKQIINEIDLFNADLSNIALNKKKRKDFIIYPVNSFVKNIKDWKKEQNNI